MILFLIFKEKQGQIIFGIDSITDNLAGILREIRKEKNDQKQIGLNNHQTKFIKTSFNP